MTTAWQSVCEAVIVYSVKSASTSPYPFLHHTGGKLWHLLHTPILLFGTSITTPSASSEHPGGWFHVASSTRSRTTTSDLRLGPTCSRHSLLNWRLCVLVGSQHSGRTLPISHSEVTSDDFREHPLPPSYETLASSLQRTSKAKQDQILTSDLPQQLKIYAATSRK